MCTAAIIQARMGSTRLPGKVLLDLNGEPVLVRVVERVKRSTKLDTVVVATCGQTDNPIVALCAERGWQWFVGSEDDVLDRYYRAALEHQAVTVVRITSDCPLIDPDIIDGVIDKFTHHSVDYASNTLPPRTFPRGLDVEVFRFDALERAWREDKKTAWREHVTPYIYNNPEKFRLLPVTHAVDLSGMRWTVDTPEDLDLVRRIYRQFNNDKFSWREVLDVLDARPEWLDVNRDIIQKEVP
jgi:spore coat polysaccharide biosynthesis protein SpsF